MYIHVYSCIFMLNANACTLLSAIADCSQARASAEEIKNDKQTKDSLRTIHEKHLLAFISYQNISNNVPQYIETSAL